MNLISTAAEFGYNVLREKTSITSGDIHVDIVHANKTVQNRFKFTKKLDLIEKNIIHSFVRNLFLHVWHQNVWVLIAFVFKGVKGDLDDMALIDTFIKKMFLEQIEQ